MLEDAMRMLATAFCEKNKTEISVAPDSMNETVALFISLLTGSAEISDRGRAYIKPLKHPPAECPLPLYGIDRECFFLLTGVAVQMELYLRLERMSYFPTQEETDILRKATQRQLQIVGTASTVYLCSNIWNINPVFEDCTTLPEFTAGLIIGAALARFDTAVFPLSLTEDEPVKTALEILGNYGIVEEDKEKDRVIIKTLRQERFGKQKKRGK